MRAIPVTPRRSAVIVAALALVAALAGTAIAGSSEPTAVDAASAKKTAKKAKKKANQALNAAADAQSSADDAGSSADAAQDSADTAQSTAAAITGRSSYDSGCDPSSTAFLDCVGVTFALSRPGRILLNANGGQSSFVGAAEGVCRLEVDDSTAAIPHSTSVQPGETTDTSSPDAQNGFAITAVTNVLAAGSHRFEMSCSETFGDTEIYDAMISAVRVG